MAKKKKPENGDLKKKVQDAIKVMKTSKKDHKVVMDIANEIIKRGRTDKKANHQEIDKAPTALQKESKRKKSLKKRKMMKENEDLENEDLENEDLENDDLENEDLENEDLENEYPGKDDEPEMDLNDDSDLEPEFDIEDDMSDYETPEDVETSDDIDDIISDLLATENIEIDVDAEKGKVTVTDTAKDKDDKGVGKVKGDVELITDEEPSKEELGEDFNDEDIDLEMDNDIDAAFEEEKVVKEQLDEMLSSFGKTYPKIFNEEFTNKLGLIVEMYTKAKAKSIATENVAKVVKSVDVYMEKVEKDFKRENAKKLAEALDNKKRERLLEEVKTLLERKVGKVETSSDVETLDEAISILYNENRKLKGINSKLKENLFNMKTNFIFEQKTKDCTPKQKNAISKLLEDFDYKTTKEFTLKLESAISIIKSNKTEVKRVKEQLEESRKRITKRITRKKPIRRSDKTLTLESVRDAVRRKKAKRIIAEENIEKDEIPMDEYEKHIYG